MNVELLTEAIRLYDIDSLEKLLDKLSQMIVIPVHNVYNLNTSELKSLKEIVEAELNNRQKER